VARQYEEERGEEMRGRVAEEQEELGSAASVGNTRL
jgi:hypothetical protein